MPLIMVISINFCINFSSPFLIYCFCSDTRNNLRSKMSLKPKEVNFDTTWLKLSKTIKSVLQMDTVQHKIWTDCFSDVYSLCVAFPESLADRLYDEVKTLLTTHVANLYNQVGD